MNIHLNYYAYQFLETVFHCMRMFISFLIYHRLEQKVMALQSLVCGHLRTIYFLLLFLMITHILKKLINCFNSCLRPVHIYKN